MPNQKNLYLFLVCFSLTLANLHPVQAQVIGGYGIKAGYTSAGEKYKFRQAGFSPSVERRAGFTISAFFEWAGPSAFSLLSQIEYAQKGMGMEFVETSPDGPEVISSTTIYNRLDYVSLPVFAKVRITAPSISPYLFFGPRLDYLAGYSSDRDIFNEVYDRFRRFAVGGSVGVGLQAGTALHLPVLVEFRYNADFTDSYTSEFLEVSNNSFDLLMGIGF